MEQDFDRIVREVLEHWSRAIDIEANLIGSNTQDEWHARGQKDHGQAPIRIYLSWKKRFLGKPYRCFHVHVGVVYWRTMPMKISDRWYREATTPGSAICPATREDLEKTMQKICGKQLAPSPAPEWA